LKKIIMVPNNQRIKMLWKKKYVVSKQHKNKNIGNDNFDNLK
jgi:hypothetical protein